MAKLKELLYVTRNELDYDVQGKIIDDLEKKQEGTNDIYVAKVFDCDRVDFSYLCSENSLFSETLLPLNTNNFYSYQLWDIFGFFNSVEWNGHSTPIRIDSIEKNSGGTINFFAINGKVEYFLLEVTSVSYGTENFDINNDTKQIGQRAEFSDYNGYTLHFPQDYDLEKVYLIAEKISGNEKFGRFVEADKTGESWNYFRAIFSKIKIKKAEIVINNIDNSPINEALQNISKKLSKMEFDDLFFDIGMPKAFIYTEVYDIASKKTYLVFSGLFSNFMGTSNVIEKSGMIENNNSTNTQADIDEQKYLDVRIIDTGGLD